MLLQEQITTEKTTIKQAKLGALTMRVLLLYRHDRSFVHRDKELLLKHFQVKPMFLTIKNIFFLPFEIMRSDCVFIWFASYHAYLAAKITRFIKRPIIVVTGGYDVAGEPEIKYGLMQNRRFLYKMVKYVLTKADRILAVSEFNKSEIKKYLGITDVEMIYNTVDSKKFHPKGKKENIAIIVGFINWETIKRKGVETFVKAAKYLPDTRFIVIGKAADDSIDHLKKLASKNVEFTGFVSFEKLLEYYQKAKVYCQLSFYESYGMAPAEAMLCECIPVVTKRGALPEVAGDAGFFVTYGDEKETAEIIKKALKSKNGKKARSRIMKLFPPGMREKRLKESVENLVKR